MDSPDRDVPTDALREVPMFVRVAAHPLRWRLLTELARSDLRVRELTGLLGQPQSLVSYHLRRLRDCGLVTMARSSFDGRDSYYHLDLERCAQALAATGAALHPALHPTPPVRTRQGQSHPSVLFVCTGNSARSPIAEALLGRHGTGTQAISAGSHPKPRLHPHTVRVLRHRFGIDIAAQRPRHVDTLAGHRFDYVITLCDKAREALTNFGGRPRRLHWSIPDPTTAGYPAFLGIATEIDTRLRHLLPVLALTDPEGDTP